MENLEVAEVFQYEVLLLSRGEWKLKDLEKETKTVIEQGEITGN